MRWLGLALLGIVVAALVAVLASRLVSQQIGLASEPVSAGDALAPRLGRDHGERPKPRPKPKPAPKHEPEPAPQPETAPEPETVPEPETAVPAPPAQPSPEAGDDGRGGGEGPDD